MKESFRIDETAEYLGVCERTIRRLINKGELPAFRIGRSLRIRKKDLQQFLRRQLLEFQDETPLEDESFWDLS